MNLELVALEANHTWTIIELPPGKYPICCKWVYRIKCKADGSIDKYKARLVAKGHTQKEGVDFHDTFAPVAKMVIVRVVLVVAIHNQWSIAQLDINNAFLHGDLPKEIYMKIPQGYISPHSKTSVCKFQKSLVNETFLCLLVYVDDIIITGNDIYYINQVKQQVHKEFSIKDLGSLNYYLGIELLRNSTGLIMTQRKYTLELLQSDGLLNVKPSSIPFDPIIKLNHDDGDLLEDPSQYRTLVGKLLYLTITIPDISYAAQTLNQFIQAPINPHLKALIKVLRYLKTCPGQGLIFHTNTSLNLKVFCDIDWASCSFSKRSVTGYCIFLGSCLISWMSKKQTVVSRSSTEAEYRALADATCEVSWIKCLFKDLGVLTSSPTTIYCDNASAIALASNPVQHARTKHIEIDCHFVRNKIRQGLILPTFIPTQHQLADVLTKGLSKAPHYHCISKFGICDPYTLPTCGLGGNGLSKINSVSRSKPNKLKTKHSQNKQQRNGLTALTQCNTIYLLNNQDNKEADQDSDPSHPPGFTQEVNVGVSVNQSVHSDISPNIGGSQNVSGVNRSLLPIKLGGSIMELLENLVEVRTNYGYNNAGCKKNFRGYVASHGIPLSLNESYVFKHSRSGQSAKNILVSIQGGGGGILCVWDPNINAKDNATIHDYFVAVRVLGLLLLTQGLNLAQKAKVRWAIEGDENSKYFHGIINKKRSQLAIRGVLIDGDWIDEPCKVKNEFLMHFANRFESPSGPCIDIDSHLFKKLSSEQVDDLSVMCNQDFVNAIREFFISSKFPPGCNSSFIALIPKKHDAKFVKDYRPISLIGCFYKIVSKILANRLKMVISELISDVQSAFWIMKRLMICEMDFNDIIIKKLDRVYWHTGEDGIKMESLMRKFLRQANILGVLLFLSVLRSCDKVEDVSSRRKPLGEIIGCIPLHPSYSVYMQTFSLFVTQVPIFQFIPWNCILKELNSLSAKDIFLKPPWRVEEKQLHHLSLTCGSYIFTPSNDRWACLLGSSGDFTRWVKVVPIKGAHVKVWTQAVCHWPAIIVINHYQAPQITAGQSGCDTQPDVPTLTCAPGTHVRKTLM
ncbi:retrovirus-related pol polyprotein from transposon RE1 [Tanacetum coccineum]